mmetsp:Transcript_8029/g.22449  ORF Transcript_8029/g.22449 Transcript_8029/m.22449 type:complete len:324 (-) Transcript_8029:52-1023(-)
MTDFLWAQSTVVVPLGARGVINGADKPIEGLGVDLLGEGIVRVSSLDDIERDGEPFVPRHDGPLQQRLLDIVGLHTHQPRQLYKLVIAGNDGILVVLGTNVKGEVAKLQHRADRSHKIVKLVILDPDDGQCLDRLLPPLGVGAALDDVRVGMAHVGEGLVVRPHQPVPDLRLLLVGRRQQLVEDVIRPLLRLVADDAALLQQVHLAPTPGQDGRRHRLAGVRRVGRIFGIELQLDELAEARRVVIADGLGITEGLEQRVGIQYPIDNGRSSEGSLRPVQLLLVLVSITVLLLIGMETGVDMARRLEAGQLIHHNLDRLGLTGA